MCCKSQRLPPSDCQVRGGTTRCCNYQLEIHARQWLQRQRQRNREKEESRGREKTGKTFTGIRGNSSEKYSLTCTVKRMFVVVTDNRVVSSNCRVYAYTIHALQTIDSSALVVAIRRQNAASYLHANQHYSTGLSYILCCVETGSLRLYGPWRPFSFCKVKNTAVL